MKCFSKTNIWNMKTFVILIALWLDLLSVQTMKKLQKHAMKNKKKYMDLIILKICQILKCFAKTSYFRQFLNVSIESVRKKVTSLHTRKQQITSFFFGVLCLLWTLYSDPGKTCNRIIVPGRCESTCFRIDCIMIILERILVLK